METNSKIASHKSMHSYKTRNTYIEFKIFYLIYCLSWKNLTICIYWNYYKALTREYLIESQPIGKKLFREFCSENVLYNSYQEFLESIVRKFLIFYGTRMDHFKTWDSGQLIVHNLNINKLCKVNDTPWNYLIFL